MSAGNCCANCRFYKKAESAHGQRGEEVGTCNRFPPSGAFYLMQVAPTPSNQAGIVQSPAGVWPTVRPIEWCGEWQNKSLSGTN